METITEEELLNLKAGDTIYWKYKNKIESAKIAMIDKQEKCFGVYTDYGQDLIDFRNVIKIKNK